MGEWRWRRLPLGAGAREGGQERATCELTWTPEGQVLLSWPDFLKAGSLVSGVCQSPGLPRLYPRVVQDVGLSAAPPGSTVVSVGQWTRPSVAAGWVGRTGTLPAELQGTRLRGGSLYNPLFIPRSGLQGCWVPDRSGGPNAERGGHLCGLWREDGKPSSSLMTLC